MSTTDKIQALQDALAEIFREPDRASTKAEQSSPIIDHSAVAGIFSEALPISTNINQSVQSFDHQVLAEIFSELPPVPINPRPEPFSFDMRSSLPPLIGQLENREPVTNAVAVAPASNAENERPQLTKSSLAKLRSIFSIKAQLPSASVDKDPSPPSSYDRLHTLELGAEAIATASSIVAESPWPSPTTSSPAEICSPFSTDTKPSPSIFEKQSSPSAVEAEPGIAGVAVAAPVDAGNARLRQAKSLLTESCPAISADTKMSPTFDQANGPNASDSGGHGAGGRSLAVAQKLSPLEPLPPTSNDIDPSRPILSGRLDNAAAKVVEHAQPQQATSSLTELFLQIPTDTKLPPTMSQTEPSQPALLTEPASLTAINTETASPIQETKTTLSGQPNNVEVTASATTTDAEIVEKRQARSLPTEQQTLIAINTETSFSIQENTSRRTLSSQPDNVEPAAEIVEAFSPTDQNKTRPRQAQSLLSELPFPISTNTEPSPYLETEPLPLSGQLDKRGLAASTVEPVPPTEAESAGLEPAHSLPAELPPICADVKPPPPILDKEPSHPTLSSQLNNMGLAAAADFVAIPTGAESAVMQLGRAKPSLSGIRSLNPTNTKPSPLVFEVGPSPRSLCDQTDHAEPTAKNVAAAASVDAAGARQQQRTSLLARLLASRSFFESEPPPTPLFGEFGNPARADAVAMQPPQMKSLAPTELASPTSTNIRPPQILEEDLAPSRSDRIKNVESTVKAVAPPPTAVQATPQRHSTSLQIEKLVRDWKDTTTSRPFKEAHGRLDNAEPAARAVAVNSPPSADAALPRAQLAKSLLAELDLDTAIHLRWVMRDIRAKRTAITPASENDLAALVELGFVEMRENRPSLTAFGVLALD